MDKNQKKLFEVKQEAKMIENVDDIIKNVDNKTGQISFINKEIEFRTIVKEELQPVIEKSALLIEKNDRLVSAFEKAIPHFQNKMIGNENEAYLAYADNPEDADVLRVSSDKIPAESVYTLVSADLASAFGCKSCHVSMLLKELNLWNDNRFVNRRRTGKSQKTNFYRKKILDEVFKKLNELFKSDEISNLSETRQITYKQILDTMNFYRP